MSVADSSPSARFELRHPTGSTPIWIGHGALGDAAVELAAWARGRALFVVSTPRVMGLHGERLAALRAAAARSEVFEVAEGEPAKTLATAGELWNRLLAAGGRRDSRIVAFGGGSVGDLAGFVAGAYLRGVEVGQLPTTLLAQVDAAIGGKTGIDLPAAKNAVGLFHHPAFVVGDTGLLSTLPRGELRSGLAEVVKMAVLLDAELFALVERDLERLLAGDGEALAPVVAAAARAKVKVVERDPAEHGERQLLNFGHTLGHALESVAAYRGLRHGEAVAYGMLFAVRLALRRDLDPVPAGRLAALVRRFELPPLPDLAIADLMAAMGRDKKACEAGLAWVLPAALGHGKIGVAVPVSEVEAELGSFLASPFG